MSKEYTGPMRFAHRGVAQAAPENTIGAFRAAVDMGLEGIELDIRMSADGVAVIVHDENLTRHTLGHPTKFSNGIIAEMKWAELEQIELPYANHMLDDFTPRGVESEFLALLPGRQMGQEYGRSYKSALEKDGRMAKLMTFSDFLRWFEKTKDIMVEIEINAAGAAAKIFNELEKSPAMDRCIVFSGHPAFIGEIQEEAAKRGEKGKFKLGVNIRFLTEDAKEEIADMDLYEVGLNDHHISPDDINWLHSRNIKVFSNLGDYPEWWVQMCALGVDGFKTNYAAAFTKWWETDFNPDIKN